MPTTHNQKHPLEITIGIVTAMDRINHRDHPYDKKLYADIEQVVHQCQKNKLQFTTALMEALAEGNDKNPLLVQLQLHQPKHYKILTKLLDDLYENNHNV